MSSTQPPIAQRMIAGRYLIRKQIGQGRMSTVYVAQDEGSGGAEVAVKVLNTSQPDDVKRALYERETAALKRLAHPNIVRLKGAGWSDDECAFYLVLDYLPFALDRTLAGKERGLPTPPAPHRVIRELGEALVHAHSEGVVHRDIKPSNVLLDTNGRALLTDFGISKLIDQLTVGETLARFYSAGYASPEQRAARPADPRSDVYSLGAVYYRMLSGREPPPEGPSERLVDDHIQAPNPVRRTLKRLLASDPDARPQGGIELRNALSVAYRLEDLPKYYLIVTNNAFNDIMSSDYGGRREFQEVANVLFDDLGGQEHAEVHVQMDRRVPEDIIVLGDSFRLVCAKAPQGDALAIKAVQQPYMPRFDAEKAGAMAVRAVWVPVEGTFRRTWGPTALSSASEALRDLFSRLASHASAGSAKQRQRDSRREFIERWRRALAQLRQGIESDSLAIRYTGVERHGSRLRFTLAQDPPANVWEDDTPLVVKRTDSAVSMPVGNLVEVRGHVVEVAQIGAARDNVLPPDGTLTANTIEALAENDRQRHALNDFLGGQVANPDLAAAVVDPSIATRGVVRQLDYFQPWLSKDKKQAVAEALASNELFLIQGPPGTGKTSVIAELVLQILKENHTATILLSSQSNVAVDHALTRIAIAAEEAHQQPPTMVRIGRQEKIAYGGERWTLSARARELGETIRKECTPVLDRLKRDERRKRLAAKAAGELSDAELRDAGDLGEWIHEAEELIGQVEEYEHEEASIGPDAPISTVEGARALVDHARAKASQHIAAVRDLLPRPVDLEGLSLREALSAVAAAAVPGRYGQQAGDEAGRELHRIQQLRRILSHWLRVAGLGSDFEELIGKSSSVVAATCSIAGRLAHLSRPDIGFDWAIIDEAGRATVPEVLVPIVKASALCLWVTSASCRQ